MTTELEEHMDYLSAVVCSDISTSEKIAEMLPLRELLVGEVLTEDPLVEDFIRNHWSQLSRVLFALRTKDVDGFQDELLAAMIKFPPRALPISAELEPLPAVEDEALRELA